MRAFFKQANFLKLRNKIIHAFLLILIPITIGVAGYMFIENARFIDSLFMTIITVATVGYGEVVPLSDAGRLFTVFLIITNLGIFAYAISLISGYLIEGQFFEQLRKNRMKKRISELSNHVIVCGFGRNGHAAFEMLKRNKIDYVIIE